MKKYIALTALLLAAGCTSPNGNMSTKQVAPGTRIETHSHTKIPKTLKTQASSTATPGARKPVRIQQSPGAPMKWIVVGESPSQYPANRYPVTPNPVQTPVQNPTAPTTPTTPVQNPTQNPSKSPNNQTPSNSQQFDQEVLRLVNEQRASAGLNALTMDANLSKMALVKAQDMIQNNYFDHNSPTYGSPFDMMKKFGITFNSAGENIAKGQTTPSQVMNDWMNSEGHRANILGSSFTKIGIGFYNNAWVQEFTG
ncbi:CAP domain-containing protein [Paenibacillus guangzhouensis]|uniref:CAP domain-containing protein n=1 Tax=Paenibacillus guangzhouensis TaxID=1473112 RepID=UPI001266C03F|nr:CAP domain-containing protein [Paenibacillus guangzhouensis]